MLPGAVAGAVVGLAPGALLIMVLTGGAYHIDGSEALGFIVMCIAAGALLGAGLGGLSSIIAISVRMAMTARRSGRQ